MKLLPLVFACFCLQLLSCSSDEDGPAYSFKDQRATGLINNVPFVQEYGYADLQFDNELFITLRTPSDVEGCDANQALYDFVMIRVEYEEKLTLLSQNLQVTLVQNDADFENHFATQGAVEITSITETEVSGRLDARKDDKTFINGVFTVPLCF